MFFSDVFYPEVINNKIKGDLMPLLCPQPRGYFNLGVTVVLQPICQ